MIRRNKLVLTFHYSNFLEISNQNIIFLWHSDSLTAQFNFQVSMYRKYRVGELPDIQIKHSELIVPLQALAQLDSKTGMKLFSSLLNAVISKLPDKLDDTSVERVHGDLQEALDTMLRSSTVNDPCFTPQCRTSATIIKSLNLTPPLSLTRARLVCNNLSVYCC